MVFPFLKDRARVAYSVCFVVCGHWSEDALHVCQLKIYSTSPNSLISPVGHSKIKSYTLCPYLNLKQGVFTVPHFTLRRASHFLLAGGSNEQLEDIMSSLNLHYLVKREGWDKINDWNEALSGGEKQRLVLARYEF